MAKSTELLTRRPQVRILSEVPPHNEGKQMKKKLGCNSVLFKFKCLKCEKEIKVNVYEILEVGTPMCCDEEMDLSFRCFITS